MKTMPRKPTQASETRRWIKASPWLTDEHAPMVQQLIILAESMDHEKAALGHVQAATATAYRMAFRTLEIDCKPIAQKGREQIESEDDSLMSPAEWLGES